MDRVIAVPCHLPRCARTPARCVRAVSRLLVAVTALTLLTPGHATEMADAIAAYREGDFARAYEGFLPLASAGDPRAQTVIGLMYAVGEGVPRDLREAARWYRRAADAGYAAAQYNLGALYDRGQGVPRDPVQAIDWYRLAADQGHLRAQAALGESQRGPGPVAGTGPARQAAAGLTSPAGPATRAEPRLLRLTRDFVSDTPLGPRLVDPPGAPVGLALARTLPGAGDAGGYRVQLGAARSEAKAHAALAAIRRAHPALLEALEGHVIAVAPRDDGVAWHRMQLGPLASEADAERLCTTLRVQGTVPDCFVVVRR